MVLAGDSRGDRLRLDESGESGTELCQWVSSLQSVLFPHLNGLSLIIRAIEARIDVKGARPLSPGPGLNVTAVRELSMHCFTLDLTALPLG